MDREPYAVCYTWTNWVPDGPHRLQTPCVTEGQGGAARSSYEALKTSRSGQQHRARQLGAVSGGDGPMRPGLSVSCSYEPNVGICFLWTCGLHNRNSGRGRASTRLPPQLPARAPQPLTPAGSCVCSYAPPGPTPGDTRHQRPRLWTCRPV